MKRRIRKEIRTFVKVVSVFALVASVLYLESLTVGSWIPVAISVISGTTWCAAEFYM